MHSLSEKKLCLSSSIETGVLPDGTRLLKQTDRAEYLALKSEQQEIVKRFNGEQTVEGVLHSLLQEGKNPGIRAFYDLVLGAMTKGILQEGASANSGPDSETKIQGMDGKAATGIGLSLLMIFAGTAALSSSSIKLSKDWVDWFFFLAMLSVGLSLSQCLAGAALRNFGRQAYGLRIRWDRLIPFFALDARDAFMGGRVCEAAVALRGLAAPFLLAALSWVGGSNAGMLAAIFVALIVGSPFGATPAHNLLHALFRKEYELPRCAERFLGVKLFAQMFNWKEDLDEEKYLLTYSTYAILWLGGLFFFANFLVATQLNALYVAALSQLPNENPQLTWVILALLSVIIAATTVYFVWMIGRGIYRLAAPRLFSAESSVSRRAADAGRPAEADAIEFLRGTLLFSQLSDESLKKLSAAMKYVEVGVDTTVIRERDPGDSMFVIHSGRVEICKENESGFLDIIASLESGEVFGEIALLDKAPRNSTVRSTEKTGLFVLARDDFDKLLVSELGADAIKEIVQISSFLKRNPLFEDWHHNALVHLAQKFSFAEFQTGQKAIKTGEVNESFFIVYEGEFSVMKDGKELATFGPGDFCGEISLLKGQTANADVVPAGVGRCLKLGKQDFLEFVSHDFLTGLAIETAVRERSDKRRAA